MAVRLIATTNPGLESVAAQEIADLVDVESTPERRYRGAVAFEAPESAVSRLNRWGRTIHRVHVVLRDEPFEDLDHVGEITGSIPFEEYVDPDQTFGVRPTRHGDHEFSSVDVGDVVGQAIIDRFRSATGTRLAVDLDDPGVIVRAFVRNEDFVLGIDATGADSLHRRWYRECEHNAPLRPTIAASLVRLAGFEAGDRLVDPTCGSATIPIEAALAALDRRPHRDRSYADEWLAFLDPDGRSRDERSGDGDRGANPARDSDSLPTLRGIDVRDRWVRCGRVNVREAGLEDRVRVESGDATETDLNADVVIANLPYGIRTVAGDLRTLYGDLSENLRDATWRRAVFLTTRPDLLDLPVEREIPVRYGRIEASVVVAAR